ncbi:thioredoxin [Halobacteriales archaeon QS_3_64_16]|nr:MAG: thioredoxin [Halobacteriales archaeon QS_3_64_16]
MDDHDEPDTVDTTEELDSTDELDTTDDTDGTGEWDSDRDGSAADLTPEELLETLLDEEVLTIDDRTGTVTTTAGFEDTYSVYLDTYLSVPREEFVASVAETFALDSAELAAGRIEDLAVTREQLAAYLSLRSVLEGGYDPETLTRMAVVVADLEPETPVPDRLELLEDETFGPFVRTHDRAILTVWARRCAPCEAMKDDLDAVLDTVPEEAAVAGIDGDRAREFCSTHDVDAAPAIVYFENGHHRRTTVGRSTPPDIAAAIEDVYG